jgi:hypothetical protein
MRQKWRSKGMCLKSFTAQRAALVSGLFSVSINHRAFAQRMAFFCRASSTGLDEHMLQCGAARALAADASQSKVRLRTPCVFVIAPAPACLFS